ncbi:MAG: UbiA family prenyltransferase [Euryarchaeota archaeon]|nr:UbiA family prenyltransferase [Euryarchaeota archaeon]MDE1836727.1 UbiA family prenyltransferase [Euryarchaeota archaeon]MDE2044711.1 UbiA family prenyltransferase [Thermoplasmata archaeon]
MAPTDGATATRRGFESLRALGTLLMVPNLGLNLFFALAYLLVAAHGRPGWTLATLVLLAFIGARNAGHAFNQVVDREFDAKNPRTRDRPLVTGTLSVRAAVAVVAVNLAVFFLAALLINPWLTVLALPAVALMLGYSYTKRFTPATTVLLGAVQALLPAGVYLAVMGTVPLAAWTAVGAMVLFGTAFESVHSLGDLASDEEQGLFSLPRSLGAKRTPYLVGGLLAGAAVLLTVFLVESWGLSPWVALPLAGVAALAGAEVLGLRAKRPRLLPLFRLHFAMGGVFLATVVLFYL